jgi:hypothetical protein
VALDDAVRVAIAAKMKERSLSAIVAAMPPQDAKELTEQLAHRFSDARAAAAKADQVANDAAAKAPGPQAQQAKAAPKKAAQRKRAKPTQQAAAKPDAAPAAPSAPAGSPASAAPGKTG